MKLLIFIIAFCLGFVVGIPRDRLILIVPGYSGSAQRPTNHKPASGASVNRASAYRASAYGASVPKEFISEEEPEKKKLIKTLLKQIAVKVRGAITTKATKAAALVDFCDYIDPMAQTAWQI